MRSHSRYLKFLSATLLLLLVCVLQLLGMTLGISDAVAVKVSQKSELEATRLYQQGVKQFQLGQFREALESFQQVLAIYKEIGNRVGEGQTLNSIGIVYANLGQYSQALEFLKQALVIHRDFGDSPSGDSYASHVSQAKTLHYIGQVYRLQRDYARALEFLRQELTIYRQIDNLSESDHFDTRAAEETILNDLIEVYYHLEQYPQAIGILQRILTSSREKRDHQKEQEILYKIAGIYRAWEQYSQAIKFYQQALAATEDSQLFSNTSNKAIILNAIGEVYLYTNQYSQALDLFKKALTVQAINQIAVLNNIGTVYKELGHYSKALEFFQQAFTLSVSLESSINISSLIITDGASINVTDALTIPLNSNVIVRGVGGNIKLSSDTIVAPFEANAQSGSAGNAGSITLTDTLTAPLDSGANFTILSRSLISSLNNLVSASERPLGNQEELQYDKGKKAEIGKATALANMGEVYIYLGQYSRALDFLSRALVDFKISGASSQQAATLNNIGVVYKNQGNYQKSQEFYQKALRLYKKNKDNLGEAITLNNIGEIYRNLSRYSQAINYHEKALKIFQNCGNERYRSSNNCLFIITGRGGLPISEASIIDIETNWLSESKTWVSSPPPISFTYRKGEGATLQNIGVIYNELGQYEQALDFYQKALVIRKEIGDKTGEGNTLNNIGLVYNQMGQNDKALEILNQALTVKREVSDRIGEAIILNNIGMLHHELGQWSLALECLNKALTIFREFGDLANEGNTLDSIGTVYKKLGRYSEALELYQQGLALLRKVGNRTGERITLSNIGSVLQEQNQSELAIVFYKQAVNVTEAIRQDLRVLPQEQQETYTKTVADTYRSLADLLLSQGRILEAQQVLELLKVQELRDFTKDTRTGGERTFGIATNSTESEILKIHGTLIALGRKIEECQQCVQRSKLLDQREAIAKEFEQTVRSLEQEIRSRRETDKAFLDPSTLGGNAQDIVSAQPGTVLIYPLVLEDKLWILWAAKGGITKSIEVPKVGLKQLSETVVKFRQLLQNPNSDISEVKATGKQLYNWLIPESLQQELKKNQIQNLVFSLDRVTRYIPMSAVFDGEKYLVEEYNISTIISANLTQMGDRLSPGTRNTSVLALGLSEAKSGFNPLPNVPAELDAIVRQSPSDPQGIYPGLELLNQAFDRKALRDNLTNHRILHIATHGEFVPGNAYASYLLLGDGDKLPIPDIQSLRDLNKIHLVVLSACQTALGETGQDGSEIAGLSYYFLEKGAKAVMASLWQVNDESTRLLMERFYSNLAKGTTQSPITKAQALRQAQLNLLQSDRTTSANTNSRSLAPQPRLGARTATSATPGFSHPYYWAPFILIGNSL